MQIVIQFVAGQLVETIDRLIEALDRVETRQQAFQTENDLLVPLLRLLQFLAARLAIDLAGFLQGVDKVHHLLAG